MTLKRFTFGKAELCLLLLIIAAVVLRLVLILNNWPATNSDEATMDLMALHILTRGEHPIFFYGQAYMGTLEAYIGALYFRFFGVSLLSLRIGLLPLLALFLLGLYALTCLLYHKSLALVAVALLGLGSSDSIMHQFKAIGGYPEILLLGTTIFFLSSWLVLSYASPATTPESKRYEGRQWLYAALGLLSGFSLYTDPLVVPLVAVSFLALLCFCFPELRSHSGLLLLTGLLLGLFPLILYNLQHLHGYTTLNAYLDMQSSGKLQLQQQHRSLLQEPAGALLITLPMALGVTPTCLTDTQTLFSTSSSVSLSCVAWQGSWSLGYWLLWILATVLTLRILWGIWRKKQRIALLLGDRECRKQTLRLLLLVSTALSFLLYCVNPEAALAPAPTTRYLICMLIGTPALLWPLWQPLPALNGPLFKDRTPLRWLPVAILLLTLSIATGYSTLTIFTTLPTTQAFYRQQDGLIGELRQVHATRIYTDYWTCNRIIFASNEQILCNSLNDKLGPGQDRYPPYHQAVNATLDPAYVFLQGSAAGEKLVSLLEQQHIAYQQTVSNGYVIYQPVRRVQH